MHAFRRRGLPQSGNCRCASIASPKFGRQLLWPSSGFANSLAAAAHLDREADFQSRHDSHGTRRSNYGTPIQPLDLRSARELHRREPRLKSDHDRAHGPSRDNRLRAIPRPTSNVYVQLDGETYPMSPILLRDTCSCSQCVDPSTKQKLWSTTDIPRTIRAREIEQTDHGVTISWDNDIPGCGETHRTTLNTDTLHEVLGERGVNLSPFIPTRLWKSQDFAELSDIDYNAYMTDNKVLYQAIEQLKSRGLLFLSNVPESTTSVSTIAERIGPVRYTFYGYTWDVRSVAQAKNVAYTSQDLGFHMDLLYMKHPPDFQFLHCIRSSSAGGASVFTDSYKSLEDLAQSDIDSFIRLAEINVKYQYQHPPDHSYNRFRRVVEIDHGFIRKLKAAHSNERKNMIMNLFEPSRHTGPSPYITGVSWSPPFQAPFQAAERHAYDTSQLNQSVDDWHHAAQKFDKLIHRPQVVYERLMQPGECVIFDNRRVLHGRKAFEPGDAGKERWLRGAYLDKEAFKGKLRMLHYQLRASESEIRSGDAADAQTK